MSGQYGVDTSPFFTHAEVDTYPLNVCYMLSDKAIMRLFSEMCDQLDDDKGHYALEACFLIMSLHAVDYLKGLVEEDSPQPLDMAFALTEGVSDHDVQNATHTIRLSFEFNDDLWRHRCLVVQRMKKQDFIPVASGARKHIARCDEGESHDFDIPMDLLYHKDFMDENVKDFTPKQIAHYLQHKLMNYISFNEKTVVDFKNSDMLQAIDFIGYKNDRYVEFFVAVQDPVLINMMSGAANVMLVSKKKRPKQLPAVYKRT